MRKMQILFGRFFWKFASDMKITLLGTGANKCIPAFRCRCPVCKNARIAGGKDVRQNSSALIENGNGDMILIDMPPQILSLLRNSKVDETLVHDILFTHRHEDHILGARSFFHGSSEKDFIFDNKINVYMPESALKSMSGKFLFNKISDKFDPETVDYKIIFPLSYNSFFISGIKITPLETNHLKIKGAEIDEDSFGYLFETENDKSFAYLLDAPKKLPDKTLYILQQKRIDLIVVDCTYEETTDSTGHSDIQGVIELNKKINPSRMIISHIGHKNLSHKDLVHALSRHNIEVGYDGMVIAF